MNPRKMFFENQVALVTGAGSGMGLATTRAFAESGAAVVLADRREEQVRVRAKELSAEGHRALAVACDVADENQVAAMIGQTISAFGRLDVAFNNAGVQSPLARRIGAPCGRAEATRRVAGGSLRARAPRPGFERRAVWWNRAA